MRNTVVQISMNGNKADVAPDMDTAIRRIALCLVNKPGEKVPDPVTALAEDYDMYDLGEVMRPSAAGVLSFAIESGRHGEIEALIHDLGAPIGHDSVCGAIDFSEPRSVMFLLTKQLLTFWNTDEDISDLANDLQEQCQALADAVASDVGAIGKLRDLDAVFAPTSSIMDIEALRTADVSTLPARVVEQFLQAAASLENTAAAKLG